MYHVLGRMSGKSGWGAVRITDRDFVDGARIFTKTTEFLVETLESLSEKAEPLGS